MKEQPAQPLIDSVERAEQLASLITHWQEQFDALPVDDVTMSVDSLSAFALYVEAYQYAHIYQLGDDWAQRMYQKKHQRQALAAIDKAINYDSKRSKFWATKARVHKNLNQRAEALKAARKAVELDYTDPDALTILGEVQ